MTSSRLGSPIGGAVDAWQMSTPDSGFACFSKHRGLGSLIGSAVDA